MIEPKAYAKVNLFLDVLGRREDGFHEIETVMATVSEPWDQVAIGEAPDARIELTVSPSGTGIPEDASNLAYRAAEMLRARAGVGERGVVLLLQKGVPPGAGLGGGSSDAATVLLGLDRFWKLGLGPEGLGEIAAALGSDVPFFLHGGVAVCTGRGERIEPLPPPAKPIWVVTHTPPEIQIPTPQVYAAWAEHGGGPRRGGDRGARVREALAAGDAKALAASLFNGLEGPAFALYPAVAAAKAKLLEAGLLGALLSGSGSSVFGIARDEAHAAECASRLTDDLGVKPVYVGSIGD